MREQLGPYAPAWDSLLDQQPLPSPFLRSWWLEHTVRHRPRFLLALDGDRLVGGLALEEDRRLGIPRLLPMGSVLAPDHVDLIASPDRVGEVVRAVAAWLDRSGSRLIDLVGVAAGARLLEAVPAPVLGGVVEVAPFTPLGQPFDEFLNWHSNEFRRQVRKKRRRLAQEGATYHVVEDDEREQALTTLRDLHAQLFGHRSPFLAYYDRFAAAARAAPPGELVFHELRAGGEVVASAVTMEVAGRLSPLQGGRRDEYRLRGAGTVLEAAYIERACGLGFQELDHLRGAQAYKRAWAPQARDLLHVRSACGPGASAISTAFDLLAHDRVASAVRRTRVVAQRARFGQSAGRSPRR